MKIEIKANPWLLVLILFVLFGVSIFALVQSRKKINRMKDNQVTYTDLLHSGMEVVKTKDSTFAAKIGVLQLEGYEFRQLYKEQA